VNLSETEIRASDTFKKNLKKKQAKQVRNARQSNVYTAVHYVTRR